MTHIAHGLHHVPDFLDPGEIEELIGIAREMAKAAPMLHPTMRDGSEFSLRVTSAGKFAWWSDGDGYRYVTQHPQTRKPFPDIDPLVYSLALMASRRCNVPYPAIETCLVNYYPEPNGKLGMHVDRTEDDQESPIISLSIGADATFRLGGPDRDDSVQWEQILRNGDLVVQSGPSRRFFHGVTKIYPTMPNPLRQGGRLNFTLRRVTKREEEAA